VDEAHGAHLAFGPERAGAAAAGAKAWVHGCHKTLGSLTQTGMLHLAPGVAPEPYTGWLARLGSTSPSYPLLASLDLARRWAAGHGREAWDRLREDRVILEAQLREAGLRLLCQDDLPPGAWLDAAKLTLAAPQGGPATARLLHAQYGIQIEAAGSGWLTILLTPFHRKNELARLAETLIACIDPNQPGAPVSPWPAALPPRVLRPREANLGRRRRVKLAKAAGLIAADPLCPYPPGVPLIWPGELYGEEIIHFARNSMAEGIPVLGVNAVGEVAVVEA
jgi:arginine/lysine/ornithine decarboxylase